MRNTLYLLLAAAIFFSAIWQASVTGASNQRAAEGQQINTASLQVQPVSLPNYDVRREIGVAAPSRVNQLGVAIAVADPQVMQNAVESFRERFSPDTREKLRVEMNDVGLPKMVTNIEEPLSAPQSGQPDSIARDFLADHPALFGFNRNQIVEMKLQSEDNDQGTTFLNYEQMIDGIPVFQGQVQVAVNAKGQVLSINEGLVIPDAAIDTNPRLSEGEGMQRAFQFAGRQAPASFEMTEYRSAKGDRAVYRNPLGADREDILSEMRIMRVGPRAVLAWHSYVDVGPNQWYEFLIDANTGAMLYRYNIYADVAQGTVFRVNGLGQRTLESFVGDTAINTAAGWMGASTVTTGNNVEAYLDSDANNQPDPVNTADLQNGHAFSSIQDFTFPFTLGINPRTQRAAAVANLFYFNNIIHDFSYRLGFTESAGNFQTNNFGRGGTGNDSVRAEAQDGSGTNNANFGTPPEGSRPRMQMFLFTRGTADLNDDRDGDFDGDVVLHEYGHGISNRLVGGPANTSCLGGTQAGAMGEGWSDYWAATFYGNGIIGEFVTNNLTRGIRRAAYTVPANPVHDSYADLGAGGFEVHNDGEVWAATLWDLRQTLGAAIADRLVLQGMKFTPCSPSFLNARDGILMADQNLNGGANRCVIWQVFARHGMGVSARGNNGTTHVAATDVPQDCNGGGATTILFDNFETSLGWTTNPNGTDTATTGQWARANPETTTSSGTKQLGTTVSGVNDLVTGPLAGSSAGVNDIDGGVTSIQSPAITLQGGTSFTLTFSYYLAHGTNSSTADFFRVRIVAGGTVTTVFQELGGTEDDDAVFTTGTVNLSQFAGQTIRILIEAADASGASLVEAAVDDVRITRQ
ncbi:MAG TPA: M36 family metallopeptidase [Blastocatellia bacterium]|nr:M36 family metallopeptidase [Blastocatellia bacterium]